MLHDHHVYEDVLSPFVGNILCVEHSQCKRSFRNIILKPEIVNAYFPYKVLFCFGHYSNTIEHLFSGIASNHVEHVQYPLCLTINEHVLNMQ